MRQQDETENRLATETRFSAIVSEGPVATDLDVPALTVFAHPDPRRVGDMVTLPELRFGQAVTLSRLEPRFAAPGSGDAQGPRLRMKALGLR